MVCGRAHPPFHRPGRREPPFLCLGLGGQGGVDCCDPDSRMCAATRRPTSFLLPAVVRLHVRGPCLRADFTWHNCCSSLGASVLCLSSSWARAAVRLGAHHSTTAGDLAVRSGGERTCRAVRAGSGALLLLLEAMAVATPCPRPDRGHGCLPQAPPSLAGDESMGSHAAIFLSSEPSMTAVLCSSSPAAACGFDSRSVQFSSASGRHTPAPPAVHIIGGIFCLRGERRSHDGLCGSAASSQAEGGHTESTPRVHFGAPSMCV